MVARSLYTNTNLITFHCLSIVQFNFYAMPLDRLIENAHDRDHIPLSSFDNNNI